MRRRVTIATVVLFALALLFIGFRSYLLVKVPTAGLMLGETAASMRAAGLVPGPTDYDDPAREPAETDRVVELTPGPGTFLLRGSRVDITVVSSPDRVIMPDLVGRFAGDAARMLFETGLSAKGVSQVPPPPQPLDFEDVGYWAAMGDGADLVVAQDPPPNTEVPFGSEVQVVAVFPHSPSGTDTRVVDVHGLMYLRYGVEGTPYCIVCHSADTCTGPKCHSSASYDRLASTPRD